MGLMQKNGEFLLEILQLEILDFVDEKFFWDCKRDVEIMPLFWMRDFINPLYEKWD